MIKDKGRLINMPLLLISLFSAVVLLTTSSSLKNSDSTKLTDLSAQWVVYQNEEANFKISYPAYLVYIEKDTKDSVVFRQNNLKNQEIRQPSMGVRVYKTNLTPEQWVEDNTTPDLDTKFLYRRITGPNEKLVNGREVLELESNGDSYTFFHTIIKDGEHIYDLYNNVTGLSDISAEVYDQFVFSFASN